MATTAEGIARDDSSQSSTIVAKKFSACTVESSLTSRTDTKPKPIWWRALIPRMPSSDHPECRQPRPFGLNRYVLLACYVLYVFATGGVHYGWRSISRMLMKSGAYAWLCEGEDVDTEDDSYLCDKQDTAVQMLFNVAIVCQFLMAGVAGFLIDHIGPKLTAILGQSLSMSSWIFLAFCGENFQAYEVVAVLMGMGSDTGFLPTLVISNLFPGSNALILTCMGSAVSASFAMPLFLQTAWTNNPNIKFRDLCVLYAGVANGGCMVVAMFLLPWKSYRGTDQYKHDDAMLETPSKKALGSVVLDEDGKSFGLSENGNDSTAIQYGQRSSVYLTKEDDVLSCESAAVDMTKVGASNMLSCSSDDVSGRSGLWPSSFSVESEHTKNGGNGREANAIGNCADFSAAIGKEEEDVTVLRPMFIPQLCSAYFIGIVLYFCICGLAFVFYTLAAERLLGKEVENFMMVMVPFSFLPCIAIGKCIDSFGIMPVILVLNSVGIFMYAAALPGVTALGYISVLLQVVYVSVFTTQLYCYVENTFSSIHFGKLIGIGECIGGSVSFLSFALYDNLTVEALNGNVMVVCCLMIGLLLGTFFPLAYMTYIKRKRCKPFDRGAQ